MVRAERLVIGAALVLAVAGITVAATIGQSAVAGGLIALSPVLVIAYQSVQTRRAVDAAHEDVVASRQLALEAQRDRELAVQPFVTTGTTSGREGRGPTISLRNIGRGPAIQLRVLWRLAGTVHWNSEAALLAAGENRPRQDSLGLNPLLLDKQRGGTGVRDYVVSQTQPHDLVAYCMDQLGNRLRFNLRTGEPPQIWHRDDPAPEWAEAFDYR